MDNVFTDLNPSPHSICKPYGKTRTSFIKLMKLYFLVVPFLLLGCHRSDPWRHSSLQNSDPHYDMAKLSYPASSMSRGILLELIRQHDEVEGYLSVYTFEIPPYHENPHKAEVIFKAGSKVYSFIADRLKGGQRLHLSQLSLKKLLTLFNEHAEVRIEMGHYSQTFRATSFEKHLRKLRKQPLSYLPEKIVSFELY